MDNFKREVAKSIAFLTPPAGISMWLTFEQHLDDWIKLATLVYIIVQVTALVVGKYLVWSGKYTPRKGEDGE